MKTSFINPAIADLIAVRKEVEALVKETETKKEEGPNLIQTKLLDIQDHLELLDTHVQVLDMENKLTQKRLRMFFVSITVVFACSIISSVANLWMHIR